MALDARLPDVSWTLVKPQADTGGVIVLAEDAVSPPEQVVAHTAVVDLQGNFQGIGPGWHYPALEALAPASVELSAHPDARDMLSLGDSALQRGQAVSAEQAQPVYLRNEISWKKRERIRS